MNMLTNATPKMTSREISKITGKEHKHVYRDIESMLNQLEMSGEEILGYVQLWTHPQNKQEYREFCLPRKLVECLLLGYSAKARMRVLERLEELQNELKPALPQTFAEALQLAADQAKLIEEQAPKVAFVDNLVERTNLLTATQIGQKHKISAIKLNKILAELNVYNRAVKRSRVFQQWFIDKGYGEMKKTELGYDQPLFTNAGEIWINEKLISEGVV